MTQSSSGMVQPWDGRIAAPSPVFTIAGYKVPIAELTTLTRATARTEREMAIVADMEAAKARGPSSRFKIGRIVAGGIIAVATGGAALTAAGVIGSGAGVAVKAATVIPAVTSAPGGIGLTAAAAAPAYAPQIAAAQLAAAGGGALAPAAGSFALGVKSAAALVASAGSIAGAVGQIKSAGLTPEAALPAYAEQLAGVEPIRAAPGGAPAAQKSLLLAGLALLAFVILK